MQDMSKYSTRPTGGSVSYSHRDLREEAELRKHLATVEWQGHLQLLNDARIAAGDEWSRRISDGLEGAQLVRVLLSQDYLASEACRRELARALELRASRGVRLVPIVLGACDWQSTALGSPRPRGAPRPIRRWPIFRRAPSGTARSRPSSAG